MMDKKLIEKYLKLYPRIDEEIKNLEDDVDFFKTEIAEYESRSIFSRNDTENLESAKEGLQEAADLCFEHMKAKLAIRRALSIFNRQLIELHFWKSETAKWDEVAKEMGISKRTAAKMYKEFIEKVQKIIK